MRATAIRKGMILNHQKSLYRVTKTDHITPGKGNALMQVAACQLSTGKNIRLRFRSAEDVETIHYEFIMHQYLYQDDNLYNFMNLEDYETIAVEENFLGDYTGFLVESMEVGIAYHEDKPIALDFPKQMILEVTEAEPWIKGDSVSNNTKPVTLKTGLVVKVPMFVNIGDKLKIDTETGHYLERA